MASNRYNSVAISLHWLIAILLVGLVVLAKIMNSLEDDDPFRFELIQWHKSFGITALVLVVIRLLWRLTHRPPVLPATMSKLERFGAEAAHRILYLLMFMIPLSGWIMVSASPLNLKTELFGLIPWPHIPFVSALPDKAAITGQFVEYHYWLAHGLVFVVVVHIAAALRHQLFLKDNIMSRMLLSPEHGRDNKHAVVVGLILVFGGSLFLISQVQPGAGSIGISTGESVATGTISSNPDQRSMANASVSSVGFTALQLGEEVNGVFENSEISLLLSDTKSVSSMTAKVKTASINSGDSQIDSTVVTDDWFGSTLYPDATFTSTNIEMLDSDRYDVTGTLTIRTVSQSITFPMTITDGVAAGEFKIDRTDYNVGNNGQDEFVDPLVTIRFQVSADTQ